MKMTMTKKGRGQSVPLTQARVNKLKPNAEAMYRTWSSNLAGFHINVYPTGTKTYYLRYTSHAGKQKFGRLLILSSQSQLLVVMPFSKCQWNGRKLKT